MENKDNNIKHTVIKSPNDKNEYYYDILPNGLRYIVISNKDIDKSAVGLDVYIGSADDPKEYQGLAHALEHILFLGSKKYPEASGFDNFLNLNSGISNANTSLDHTNYHYDISNEELEKSVDMFSEFFIEPLFKEELVNKELNAIDSEFKLEYRDDSSRLLSLILFEGYKDSHFNKFINGNLETLKKPEIRDKVINFYYKKYDPKLMSLCIFSNKEIEQLKNMVIKYFNRVKENKEYIKTPKTKLYDENNMGYYYKIIPIKDNSYLEFFWIINKSYSSYIKSEPYTYVISLLGHEGKHSLTSYLKKKVYIYSLEASYNTISDFYTSIIIKVRLTDEGYNNINHIIEIVLSYIKYLQKEEIHKDFFEEIKKTSEIEFLTDEQYDPIDLCEDISSGLNTVKLNEEIYIKSKIEEYKPDLIKEILDYLSPKNLNIYLLSDKLRKEERIDYQKENIYGTEFKKEKVDFSSFIIDIKSNKDIDLSYPELNPFLPNNLKMIDLKTENINLDDFKNPKKVYDNERIIWYKPVIKYNMPKCYISCNAYISNLNLEYTKYNTYCDIFFKLMNKELSEFNYLGETSENSISLNSTISSIIINIEGYTDSIENYINEYFKKMHDSIDIENIEKIHNKLSTILERIIKNINNFYLGNVRDQTEFKLKKILREITTTNKIEICEKLKENIENKIIPKDFLNTIKNLFKKVKFEWLIEGNMYFKDAEKIIIKVENELEKNFGGENVKNKNKEILSINEIRKQRILNLPEGIIYRYNFSSKDKENESSTILIYFQIGNFYYNDNNIFNKEKYDIFIKNKSLLFMIHSIFYEHFYDELRTVQQVGYDADLQMLNECEILGLYFFISSTKYNPDEILDKINNFIIDNDINEPDNFSDEDYESYKKSVITLLLQKPLTLEEEYNRDFSFISYRTYDFSLREDLINYTKNSMTKQDVIDFFNEYIYKKAKRLEVALYFSKKHQNEEKMDIEDNEDKNQKPTPEANRLYGDIWLLERLAGRTGLIDDLREVFASSPAGTAEGVLTLAIYLIATGRNFDRAARPGGGAVRSTSSSGSGIAGPGGMAPMNAGKAPPSVQPLEASAAAGSKASFQRAKS